MEAKSPKVGLTGLKSKVSARLFLLEAVGENPFPCLFRLLEVVCIP